MGIRPTDLQQAFPEPGARVPIGGLTGAFLIVCVECQRHWPETISLIYLVISGSLFALWVGYLTVWPKALRYSGIAINCGIFALLGGSLIFSFGQNQAMAVELAKKLLFWSPLVAAWWAWTYFDNRFKLAGLLGIFFVSLIWQMAGASQDISEHLILSLLVAAIVYHARKCTLSDASDANMKLRDALTGLSSAECFEAELAHVSAISDRYQMPMSLIGCQLGLGGQGAGQHETLHVYADAITDRMRTSDTACRWDDKTFMVLLPNTTEKQANTVAHNIENALRAAGLPAVGAMPDSIMIVEHQPGEDPMSTLSALESKLSTTQQTPTPDFLRPHLDSKLHDV